VIGIFVGALHTCLYALPARLYPPSIKATGIGTAVGVGRIGAMIGAFVGVLVMAYGSQAFFLFITTGVLLCGAGLLVVCTSLSPPQPPIGELARSSEPA